MRYRVHLVTVMRPGSARTRAVSEFEETAPGIFLRWTLSTRFEHSSLITRARASVSWCVRDRRQRAGQRVRPPPVELPTGRHVGDVFSDERVLDNMFADVADFERTVAKADVGCVRSQPRAGVGDLTVSWQAVCLRSGSPQGPDLVTMERLRRDCALAPVVHPSVRR